MKFFEKGGTKMAGMGNPAAGIGKKCDNPKCTTCKPKTPKSGKK